MNEMTEREREKTNCGHTYMCEWVCVHNFFFFFRARKKKWCSARRTCSTSTDRLSILVFTHITDSIRFLPLFVSRWLLGSLSSFFWQDLLIAIDDRSSLFTGALWLTRTTMFTNLSLAPYRTTISNALRGHPFFLLIVPFFDSLKCVQTVALLYRSLQRAFWRLVGVSRRRVSRLSLRKWTSHC